MNAKKVSGLGKEKFQLWLLFDKTVQFNITYFGTYYIKKCSSKSHCFTSTDSHTSIFFCALCASDTEKWREFVDGGKLHARRRGKCYIKNVSIFFFAGLYANFADHCKTEIGDSQLPDLVDFDEYDRKVFRNPRTHRTLQGYLPRGSAFRRIRSALEMQRMAKSISRDDLMFQKVSSPSRGISSFEDLDLEVSSSSSSLMVSNC